MEHVHAAARAQQAGDERAMRGGRARAPGARARAAGREIVAHGSLRDVAAVAAAAMQQLRAVGERGDQRESRVHARGLGVAPRAPRAAAQRRRAAPPPPRHPP
ncbi:hypothetical protein AQ741_28935, partial [Burkholderia pseudomallei]